MYVWRSWAFGIVDPPHIACPQILTREPNHPSTCGCCLTAEETAVNQGSEVAGPREGESRLQLVARGVGYIDAFMPPSYVDNYLAGRIELARVVTHTMPLEDINRAFDLMHEGKRIRSVIIS